MIFPRNEHFSARHGNLNAPDLYRTSPTKGFFDRIHQGLTLESGFVKFTEPTGEYDFLNLCHCWTDPKNNDSLNRYAIRI